MLEAHFLRSFLQFGFGLKAKNFKSALFLNIAKKKLDFYTDKLLPNHSKVKKQPL
jgi:hypothetical protein